MFIDIHLQEINMFKVHVQMFTFKHQHIEVSYSKFNVLMSDSDFNDQISITIQNSMFIFQYSEFNM